MLELNVRARRVLPAAMLLLLFGVLRPAGALAQEARPEATAAIARADSIRNAYAAERPPGDYTTDWVDVVGFPLKVIGFPIDLLLVRLPAYAIGMFTLPRQPGILVRALRASSEAGVHPGIRTSIGPQSGVGAGIFIDRFDPLYFNTSFTVRGSQQHRIGLRFGGERADAGAEVRWQRDARAQFFGIGSRTPDDKYLYRREVADVGVRGGLAIGRSLRLDLGVGYEDNFVREPLSPGDEVSIFEIFGPGELFGTEGRQRYVRLGAGIGLDFTHQTGFQRRGVSFLAAGTAFRGVRDTESDFHRLEFTAQGHLPLNARQILVLRGHTELTRAEAGEVPFYHLSTLGGRESAIGFPSNRFADLDMVTLIAEWRYEIWRDIHNSSRLETFLYFGEGAVAPRLADIETPDWHESYGIGLRAASTDALLGRLYFGFSEESFHVGVSGELQP